MANKADPLNKLLAQHGTERENLIPLLQDVQDLLGYLSADAIDRIGDWLSLSANEVFGVASFYSQFRFHPPGKHCAKICQGTACHVRGSNVIMASISRKLGIAAGETTPDHEFSLDEVMCLGSCALAPAAIVDDQVVGRITAKKLEALLAGVAH